MHALRLPPRFATQHSPRHPAPPLRAVQHVLRGRCLFLLIAILAILASTPRSAHATVLSTQSQTKFAAAMITLSPQQTLRHGNMTKLRPLIPLDGLPMFPAVLLWFPETESMSDVQVVGVQSEPANSNPRSYRWIKIGMLILFGMGLLGMLFS